MKKSLFTLAGVVAFAVGGQADIFTVSYTVTGPDTAVNGSTTPPTGGTIADGTQYAVPVPKWDPALFNTDPAKPMSLIGVTYSIQSTFYGNYSGSWTATAGAGTGRLTFSFTPATFSLDGADNGPSGNFTSPTLSLTTGIDWNTLLVVINNVPKGTTKSGTTTTVASATESAGEDPGNLGLYTGTGTVDLFLTQQVIGGLSATVTGAGGTLSTTASTTPFASSIITVTYTYVPEAGTLAGACTVGLGAGVVLLRRRRAAH